MKLKFKFVNLHIFFSFRDHGGSDFQKNPPQRCKIEIKTRWKPFFRDHICMRTEISPQKNFTLFSNQREARGFNIVSNVALQAKSLPTTDLEYGCSA